MNRALAAAVALAFTMQVEKASADPLTAEQRKEVVVTDDAGDAWLHNHCSFRGMSSPHEKGAKLPGLVVELIDDGRAPITKGSTAILEGRVDAGDAEGRRLQRAEGGRGMRAAARGNRAAALGVGHPRVRRHRSAAARGGDGEGPRASSAAAREGQGEASGADAGAAGQASALVTGGAIGGGGKDVRARSGQAYSKFVSRVSSPESLLPPPTLVCLRGE